MPSPLERLRHHVTGAIERGEAVAVVEQPARNPAWRIERNHKLQFCVVRDTEDGREFVTSAGGKPSSFKTWAGAQRALRGAEARECLLCGEDAEDCGAAHGACEQCGEDGGTRCGLPNCTY